MFIYPWSSHSARGETINRALLDHEHRMVGSSHWTERYVKERDFVEYENIAIPDLPMSFNGEVTLQTNHIERREIKVWKYFLMERIWEHTWNKYKGENDNKIILEMVVHELTPQEYQAYKKLSKKF